MNLHRIFATTLLYGMTSLPAAQTAPTVLNVSNYNSTACADQAKNFQTLKAEDAKIQMNTAPENTKQRLSSAAGVATAYIYLERCATQNPALTASRP